jgi:hypothetical protein
MFTLFIASVIVGSSELKWTAYDTYETHISCLVSGVILETDFEEKEVWICAKNG